MPISKEEMQQSVARDFEILKTKMDEEAAAQVEVVKRPVGRPRGTLEATLLTPKVEEEEPSSKKLKVRGNYTNWFEPSLWDPIYAAVRKHRNINNACKYLKMMYKKPGESYGTYEKLSRSSMYEWFTTTGELKDAYKKYVDEGSSYFQGGNRHCPILSNHPELKEAIIEMLHAHRKAGQPLYARSIRNLIIPFIQKRAPNLLVQENSTSFKVSLSWVRTFVRNELNWSFRKATTAASKLPKDWEQQGLRMTQRIAYLVKCYNVPCELVVNTDQTGIHLVPTGGTKTWEEKGSKHVAVIGIEDKRQVTVAVSSSLSGNILPFQVIFTGTTTRSLPPMNQGRKKCEEAGWHITHTSNHWSNLDSCKGFVEKILQPYRLKQIEILGLPLHTPLIWLIDCWSVHTSTTFLTWLKLTHPLVKTIFVPANCTSVLQPADVILQRPFKHAFRNQYDKWSINQISQQLDSGEEENITLDSKLSVLKPLLCSWLYEAWLTIHKKRMVQIGWEQCGIAKAFENDFQEAALCANLSTPLFKEEGTQIEDVNKDDLIEDMEPDTCITTVMQESLEKAAEISRLHGARVTSLKDAARKRYVSSAQITTQLA